MKSFHVDLHISVPQFLLLHNEVNTLCVNIELRNLTETASQFSTVTSYFNFPEGQVLESFLKHCVVKFTTEKPLNHHDLGCWKLINQNLTNFILFTFVLGPPFLWDNEGQGLL